MVLISVTDNNTLPQLYKHIVATLAYKQNMYIS